MRTALVAAALVVALYPLGLSAQGTAQSGSLSETEKAGKRMFQQRCSICHTPPVAGNQTYGPLLSSESVAGKENAVRQLIRIGSPRMPGFQYGLEAQEIDNIIAYLKTVQKSEPTKPQD